MVYKVGNLDVVGCLENRGGCFAFVQKALNWHDFCEGVARLSSSALIH